MRLSFATLLAIGVAASLSVHAQIKAQSHDTPSYIQFAAQRYEVEGCDSNAVITVVRSGDYRLAATVDYTTQDGTAEGNVHFRPCGGTINFEAGQSVKTISIPIIRDEPAPPKTFQVELVQTASSSLVVTPVAEVEIKSQPTLSIATAGGTVKLTWADVGLPFVLETNGKGAWNGVAKTAVLVDGEWKVELAANASVELYRLRASAE